MLERNRFLAIKNLAKDIRSENEKLFKALEKETVEDAVKEKDEFIESVIDNMEIAFSDGEQGKEEKQIFRANILIPNDADFFETYSKDKNIRNLMNKYAVSIEDIMSKITELNIYGKYIDSFEETEEPEDVEEIEENEDFVNEMVNLSSKDAESLLDEIEDLSNVMEELNIKVEDNKDTLSPEILDEKEEKDETPSEEIIEPSDMVLDDEFEDITNAVSGFVDEYSKVQEKLDNAKSQIKKFESDKATYEEKISTLETEIQTLRKNNLESVNALNAARELQNSLKNENITLKEQIKVMERKIKQTSVLLKKIYNSIPKKQN